MLLAGALWMLVGTPIANGPFIYAVSDGVDAPPPGIDVPKWRVLKHCYEGERL